MNKGHGIRFRAFQMISRCFLKLFVLIFSIFQTRPGVCDLDEGFSLEEKKCLNIDDACFEPTARAFDHALRRCVFDTDDCPNDFTGAVPQATDV